ncbi:MAG: TMEM165/GDT1 family protein [Cyanobacteria bacterium P01_A01_bin.3]
MTSPNPNRTVTLSVLGLAIAALTIAGLTLWQPAVQQLVDASLNSVHTAIAQLQNQPADASGDENSVLQWLLIAFSTVFVAEMGDKTQLATMLMSAQGKSPWSIFFGSASALVAASLVSVTLGGWLSTLVPPELLQGVAGVSFILLGIYVLWAELTGADEDDPSSEHCMEGEDG